MNLYRIISLETFVDLIHNKHERYVRPVTWEDTYEGYLISELYNPLYKRKIIEDMYYNVCPHNYRATIDNLLKLEHAKWFVYGQSWASIRDSDAMWRIYSYNKHSIQIQTTEKRVKNILGEFSKDELKYEIKRVKYDVDAEDDILHGQIMQLKQTCSTYEPFLHKRKAFRHEYEIRILLDDVRWFSITEMSRMGASWKIDETVKTLKEHKRILDEIEHRLDEYMGHWNEKTLAIDYFVDITDLSKYVSGVRVNPFAEEWYVKLIEGICGEYNIKFNGKSDLYVDR